ncbi:lipocalin family protein [Candidatus Margulisiibacteriota bacterium]
MNFNKYLGAWHEIARLPNWFEKDLVGVTATYSLKENGDIEVLNQGYIKSLDGKHKKAIGNAWIPDKTKTGRLKVSFFGPFSADYIVIDIDKDYQYALVGSGENYLWILSRKPILNKEIYPDLVAKAKELGFATNKLIKVVQQ